MGARFLEPYGYIARDSYDWWGTAVPEIFLKVGSHSKSKGHTYYNVECAVCKPGQWHSPYLSWTAQRRLLHMRDCMHDVVKRELGSAYKERFAGAPFAHKGAPSGTTARLSSWCRNLAENINAKSVPPFAVAVILRFLGAPDPVANSATASEPVLDAQPGDAVDADA